MKKYVVFLFVILLTNNFSQTNISPQLSELKGMEDQQGNTHLFYRIFTYYANDPIYQRTNHIYHWDINTNVDTFFLYDGGLISPPMSFNDSVSTLEFWNSNINEFIYGGGSWGQYFEGSAYVRRFDGYETFFQGFEGSVDYINISPTNDSIIYLGGWTQPNPDPNYIEPIIAKSSNGGIDWDTFSTSYRFLSLVPYRENIFFVDDLEAKLFRTTDSGNTFNLVDPDFLPYPRFFYDTDEQHIYRKLNNKLIVSNNLGEQFSWQTKYSSDSKIFISIDESISGTIYIADKKNIFISTDFGDNFSLYKTLDRKIVGIYKKPNSNKLYAATKCKIYEITPDTIQVIKSLPAIDDLKWYPLSIGNKWIFENYRQEFEPPSVKEFIGICVMEVIDDTLVENQIYYKLKDEPLYWNIDTGLVRPDSLDAKLFIYLPEQNREILYEDFLAQVGDTIWIDSTEYKILENEEPFSVWGKDTYKRTIDYQQRFQEYELVKDIGLFKWGFSDFFAIYTRELKGCIIDGVVYGDTTTVGVEDGETPIATEFKLEQNYPNPFNPSTVISYRLPVTSSVTLKVYDVLGNEIATLVNEEKPAGEYEVTFDSHSGEVRNLPSGIYFYQLRAGNFVTNRKMVLLK